MKNKHMGVILALILLASVIYYTTRTGRDYLPDMKRMAGEGRTLEWVAGQNYQVSFAGKVIGYIGRQSAVGYAGPIEVLVYVGLDGKIKEVLIVDHTETPLFINKVLNEGFVKDLKEREANSHFELGKDLDGVTRATYTSKGIAEAVRKASHHIATTKLNMDVPKPAGFRMALENYLLLGLLLAVFIIEHLKLYKLRYAALIAGFLLIGYWQKSLLSLGSFSSVLSGSIPWQTLPFWLILLAGVLAIILISGRNLYCYWMCPYGGLAELLAAFGRFGHMECKPCVRSLQRFKNLPLFLAWGGLVFAFTMQNPGISSYEIFAPLFAWEGVAAQWLMLPVMLFACVFILRFWCRIFCPVGGILNLLVKCRKSCLQWFKKNNGEIREQIEQDSTRLVTSKHSAANLIFNGLILFGTLLVLIVLLQNAGIM